MTRQHFTRQPVTDPHRRDRDEARQRRWRQSRHAHAGAEATGETTRTVCVVMVMLWGTLVILVRAWFARLQLGRQRRMRIGAAAREGENTEDEQEPAKASHHAKILSRIVVMHNDISALPPAGPASGIVRHCIG